MNIKSKLLVLFSQYNLILDSLKLMLLSKRNEKPGDYKGLPVWFFIYFNKSGRKRFVRSIA